MNTYKESHKNINKTFKYQKYPKLKNKFRNSHQQSIDLSAATEAKFQNWVVNKKTFALNNISANGEMNVHKEMFSNSLDFQTIWM